MTALARSIRASCVLSLRSRPLHFRVAPGAWTTTPGRLRLCSLPRENDVRISVSPSEDAFPMPLSSSSASTSSGPSPPPQGPAPVLSKLSLSLSMLQEDEEYYKRFGYTWLTHIRLAEEDNVFRQQIAEVRGRGRGSRYGSYETLGSYESYRCSGSSSSSEMGSSDDSDDELILSSETHGAISGLLPSLQLPVLESPTSQANQDLTSDLEWLSSQNEVIYNKRDEDLSRPENAIVPLWISVHIDEDSKTASLYESVVPVEPNVVEKLEMKDTWRPFYVLRLEEEEAERNRFRAFSLEPDARVPRLTFDEYPEYTCGPWRNYFVGLWGEVAAVDEGTLWPNRVLHKDRCVYNVRNGLDLVRFLADPRKRDIEDHARNLERLANGGIEVEQPVQLSEETVSSPWVWGLLKSRWGSHGLKKHGYM